MSIQWRLLVTGAGRASANNLVRSLRAAGMPLRVVGCHTDRFLLKKSPADRNYLVPGADSPGFLQALLTCLEQERIDLIVPTTDFDVARLSVLRDHLPCRVFLPSHRTIELCQDKYALAVFLHQRDLPVPATRAVTDLSSVADVFHQLTPPVPVWCRIRHGTDSMGATSVKSAAQARAWIEYWYEMRGVPPSAFTLSEYLPGRDFACQSLWSDGQLILVKTFERLSYVGGPSRPSGVSSIAALAKTVNVPAVVDVCTRVVRALDRAATGVFAIDLKENAAGVPCVTEINAGRFFTMTNLLDLCGKYNMTETYVRMALGEPVVVRGEYDAVEDYYVVRDVDTLPDIFHADELFEGVQTIGGCHAD